ncbi:MAG: HDIG domain-containing protein [Verrucomicrobiales bacterium]|nr:HDIG domain-containing protein [Verrucomicrobiales bacterium]
MLNRLFSNSRLKQQGFSSGLKRRTQKEDALRYALAEGHVVRFCLFFLFAVGISSLVIYGVDSVTEASRLFSSSAQIALVVTLITLTMSVQFYINLPQSFARNSRVLMMLVAIGIHLLLIELSLYLVQSFALGPEYVFLMAPCAFAPMIMSLLLGRNHGTMAALYASLLGSLLIVDHSAFEFLIFSLVSGFAAVYFTHNMRRRSRLVRAGLFVGLINALLACFMGMIPLFDFSSGLEWNLIGMQCLTAVFVGILTAMVVGGILPVLESAFGITTALSWLEMADLNHPLMKRMTLEAPGTYHHCLVLANLSEAAAETVGANGTKCRACSYFHDIGKLNKPSYFIENSDGIHNPHDELTPTMSALVIMAHVKDGVDLALKHHLNTEIIDIIREHHGTSLIYYFYHRALKRKEKMEQQVRDEKAREEDVPEVSESGFRYPGPRPRSKEGAIISLADAVESASRSLVKPTPQRIEQLIEEITDSRLRENQLDECELTLHDIALIKKSFATTLRSMMHNRIAYPKQDDAQKDKGAAEEDKAARKKRKSSKSKQDQKPDESPPLKAVG